MWGFFPLRYIFCVSNPEILKSISNIPLFTDIDLMKQRGVSTDKTYVYIVRHTQVASIAGVPSSILEGNVSVYPGDAWVTPKSSVVII